jgi:putative phage-type endonuclease
MRAVLLGQEIQNTPEWHALRTNGIGGSEVAAIVGLSPWESRFSLYHRKAGTLGEKESNAGMSWGTRIEPLLCEVFAEQHPEYAAIEAGTYRHHERTWQLANVDRLLMSTDGGEALSLLEAKTAHTYSAWQWGRPGTEDVPPYYRCQAMWYLDVLELERAHLAVLIGGSDYREYEIAYDPTEAAWLRNEAEMFWREVVDGTPPPLDGSDATYEAVRDLHPQITGEDVQISPQLWDEYLTTKQHADEASAKHKRAKSAVLDAMGQARRALVGETPVLRRQGAGRNGVALHRINEPKEGA